MALQTRAEATRQSILSAAVELFTDHGYAETGLTDITNRAKVTTGAFYYHFESKEAVAATLINEGWPKAVEVIRRCIDAPAPGLENVIVMTYALSALMKRDKSVWIANHLNQAFGQLSEEGRRDFKDHAREFTDMLTDKLKTSDFLDDVTPHEVANLVWMTLHGCHLLSDAMQDSVVDRLSESWPLILRGIVHPDSLPYFKQFVTRTAAHYDDHAVRKAQ